MLFRNFIILTSIVAVLTIMAIGALRDANGFGREFAVDERLRQWKAMESRMIEQQASGRRAS